MHATHSNFHQIFFEPLQTTIGAIRPEDQKECPSSAAASTPRPKCAEPLMQLGEVCACFEDNTPYFGNNINVARDNPQPSRDGFLYNICFHSL